ncbi:MAG: metallophosphoesterase [Bacilli bacterium]|nr:metallophosphoesterase [Bacilli bacterium]MDY6430238.1 metallophosphoesterase [Bacilli bacterium]
MKCFKKFWLITIISFLLGSCSSSAPKQNSSLTESSSEISSSEIASSSEIISSSSNEEKSDSEGASSEISEISTSEILSSEEESESIESSQYTESLSEESSEVIESSESISSESSEESSTEPRTPETFKFYAVNDFHGAVNKFENDRGYLEKGMANYFGYLKDVKNADPEHTFVFSAGDMWEGSYESNFNYGELVTEAMNMVPFDAMTLGNHEFDWGQDKIAHNAEIAEFPMLCANIREYKYGYISEKFPWKYADLIGSSTIIEKSNYKIGVVGTIGSSEITSITSSRVSDIGFLSEEVIATEEAVKLKESGCDAVILLAHYDAGDIHSWSCYKNLKTYFDGVFCAHTHTSNNENKNGVPLVQSYCNGQAYSYFELTIDDEGVTCNKQAITYGYEAEDTTYDYFEDFYQDYLVTSGVKEKLNTIAGTLVGGNLTKTTSANLGNVAVYEHYIDLYPDLAITMMNDQRSNINEGEVTYSDIFKALPFFNQIVIVKLSGKNIKSAGSRSNFDTYIGDTETYDYFENDKLYTVAIIDYLLYHQNTSRIYNYFTDMSTGVAEVIATYPTYPADLIFEYMQEKQTIYADDYSNFAPGINTL